ncbi:MAG: ribonuclease III [Omnitrophica bacterium RIFCSPHIGHO2_02_FULL_46_11]|nr:MAG: ribonuclease III [Omnitrophica bacterium RIFCSPHIGHO2_02_FULL_46_11]OGW87575.1 MAG: ribonuclease III [Omnitrophica bacterium RIFCSPLOWO2_01_FULL_45_10b]
MAKTYLERMIGKPFRNKKWLHAALTHPSYQNAGQPLKSGALFQRLEFLGDSILNLFIATRLYDLFPNANEGLLSRLRSTLVSKKLLARIARTIRLKSHLLLGKHVEQHHELAREKILADAFEALIAAIYFDRGRKAIEQFLTKCFEPYFNQKKLFQLDPNPKSTLQEHTQKKFGVLPSYRVASQRNRSAFTAWVTIRGKRKTKGEGRTKQEAETQAAAKLIKKLKINPLKVMGKN